MKEIPKIIWLFRFQGWANMNPYIHKCLDSWKHRNPKWTIRKVDSKNYNKYIDLNTNFRKGIKLMTSYDIIILSILKQYGGVCVDYTFICERPLDSWLSKVIQNYLAYCSFGDPRPFVPSTLRPTRTSTQSQTLVSTTNLRTHGRWWKTGCAISVFAVIGKFVPL